MKYCIQIQLCSGDWETMGDERYPDEEAAQEALREFRDDVKYAHEKGYMSDDYSGEAFRIVGCTDDAENGSCDAGRD